MPSYSPPATSPETAITPLGSRLRSRRHELGLTLQEVAAKAGLSIGFISQLERGLTSPSLSSLATISIVLEKDITDFLSIPGSGSSITRSKNRQPYSFTKGGTHYERISSEFHGHMLNAVIQHHEPGYRSESITHDGEELLYVLTGSLTAEIDGNAVILHPGDSLHFESKRRHSSWNHTTKTTSVLVVCTLDVFGDSVDERRMIESINDPSTAAADRAYLKQD